ncbi:MAG TPA: HlyD family efflux transporter periplasmic adaptor subunit [Allosphingosinicella sp.]|nr:HlyD family efflux transporter periplasmic adaptor subunit [Allosphingosinicella sp.]
MLFRKEALDHVGRRLEGGVILAVPVGTPVLTLIFLAVATAGLIFASLAGYDQRIRVSGVVLPESGLVRVTARSDGLVEHLSVREGQSVAAGTYLAQMRLSSSINGESGGQPTDVSDAVGQMLDREVQAAHVRGQARQAELGAELQRYRSQISTVARRITAIDTRIGARRESLELAEADHRRVSTLADRGFSTPKLLAASKNELLNARSALEDARTERAGLEGEAAEARALMSALGKQREAQTAEVAEQSAARSVRRLDLSSRQQNVVTAPIAGKVAAVPVVVGQSLSRDNVVAIIVPHGDKLILEMYVPGKAAGLLQVSQDVRIYYDAFPFQRFGSGKGRIESISGTLISPSELPFTNKGLQEPVFRVLASIQSDQVRAYGRAIKIQPGMTAQIDVVTGRRTMFEWLFDPIFAAMERSV